MMLSRNRLLVVAVTALGVAGLALALLRPARLALNLEDDLAEWTPGGSEAWFVTVPPGTTANSPSAAALSEALLNGDPLPPGMTADHLGKVTRTITGVVIAGEHDLVITVLDDADDLLVASVSINGQRKATATREDGAIVEKNGKALATMSVLLPALYPYTVEVTWYANNGDVQKSALTWAD